MRSPDQFKHIIEAGTVEASAPCRIDMGGTLDIPTLHYPLRHLEPCTFNIAINLRTRVQLAPFRDGWVKVSSRGFESAEFPLQAAPFDHPLGLMFAVAAYFGAAGVHIQIESSSPPRSALGGSSAAAVALVAAFLTASGEASDCPKDFQHRTAMLAHMIETVAAGGPCGFQDQLAASYGGVNVWYWSGRPEGTAYQKKAIRPSESTMDMDRSFLVAYCGVPHESMDVNRKWIRQFLSGMYRVEWEKINEATRDFVDFLGCGDLKHAGDAMNREMVIRRRLTPDVVDDLGGRLLNAAVRFNCGARITGAGGGGCLWALGKPDDICRLKPVWQEILNAVPDACLLDARVDPSGVRCDNSA